MKVTQEKPKVIGYHRVLFNNEPNTLHLLWKRHELEFVSNADIEEYGVKSKFRPVYEVKNES